MVKPSTIEYEVRNILFNIWIFKHLKPLKYNEFRFIPSLTTLFLFFSGLLFSFFFGLFHFLLELKIYYLLLSAIFLGLTAFQWYILNYPKMLASIFPIFRATEDEYILKLKEIKIANKNSILITASLATSLFGIVMTILFWSDPEMIISPIWVNTPSNTIIDIYLLVLIGICGIILGTGLLGYLESVWMISKICQFEIDLVKVYILRELTWFNHIFTLWGLIAISLFIILIFENFTLINLFLVVSGSFVILLAFSLPQICFHFSITKSKNKELKKITDIYKIYYCKLLNEHEVSNNELLILGRLQSIRRDIEETRTFFYDFDSIINLIIGSFLPSIALWLISKL